MRSACDIPEAAPLPSPPHPVAMDRLLEEPTTEELTFAAKREPRPPFELVSAAALKHWLFSDTITPSFNVMGSSSYTGWSSADCISVGAEGRIASSGLVLVAAGAGAGLNALNAYIPVHCTRTSEQLGPKFEWSNDTSSSVNQQ